MQDKILRNMICKTFVKDKNMDYQNAEFCGRLYIEK